MLVQGDMLGVMVAPVFVSDSAVRCTPLSTAPAVTGKGKKPKTEKSQTQTERRDDIILTVVATLLHPV